jgi:hypothetical protein
MCWAGIAYDRTPIQDSGFRISGFRIQVLKDFKDILGLV